MPIIICRNLEKCDEKKLRRRLWCKAAVCFYLVNLCIGLPLGLVCFAISSWTPNSTKPSGLEQISLDNSIEIKMTASDSAFILLVTMSTVNIYVVLNLIKASNDGRHSADILALTHSWRHVNVAFLIYAIVKLWYTTPVFTSATNLLLHALLIAIAWHFMKELEAIKAKAHSPSRKDASVQESDDDKGEEEEDEEDEERKEKPEMAAVAVV